MTPEWAPLEQVLGPRLCECFMFMGRSGELYLYKHIDTRRYLNLDAEGRCFRYTGFAPEGRRRGKWRSTS